MQFWSGTAFMKTSDILALARMFDEAGYDGMICSDHLIYPRELSSPYPDSSDRHAAVAARDGVAGLLGADRRDGGGDDPAALHQRRLRRTLASPARGGQAGRDCVGAVRRAGVAHGRRGLDAGGVRPDGPGLRQPRQATQRDDSRAAGAVAGRLGVVERRVLRGARDDDRAPPPTRPCRSCVAASPTRLFVAPHRCATAGSARLRLGRRGLLRRALKDLRREYGRESEPFEIMFALLEMPTPDSVGARRTSVSPR